jgi:predicted alpha/beta hydrolase family esterase
MNDDTQNVDDKTLEYINQKSTEILFDWIKRIEQNTEAEYELMAHTYACMVAIELQGYSIDSVFNDVKESVSKLQMLLNDSVEEKAE